MLLVSLCNVHTLLGYLRGFVLLARLCGVHSSCAVYEKNVSACICVGMCVLLRVPAVLVRKAVQYFNNRFV